MRAARAATATILDHLTDEEWARAGTHTEMGAYGVEAWLRVYAEHPYDHAEQARAVLRPSGRHGVSMPRAGRRRLTPSGTDPRIGGLQMTNPALTIGRRRSRSTSGRPATNRLGAPSRDPLKSRRARAPDRRGRARGRSRHAHEVGHAQGAPPDLRRAR